MTLSIIFILFVLGNLCLFFKLRKLSLAIHASWLTLFLLIGCGTIPTILLQYLQAPYAEKPTIVWGEHNAIILLGGGNTQVAKNLPLEVGFFAQGRINKTVELYRACQQAAHDCKIIVSGGDAQGYGASEASIYDSALLVLGVNPQDIILEDQSMNTWQNAQFTREILQHMMVDKALLVSSAIHLYRSRSYFAHFGIDVLPVRSDYLRALKSLLPLGYNFAMTDLALHEYLGYLRYHVYNYLGWNVNAIKPHAL